MTVQESLVREMRRWRLLGALGVVAGGVVCAAVATSNGALCLRAYLLAFLFMWAITAGCLAILMLYYLVGGQWGVAIRPLVECGSRAAPLTALLFLPLALGGSVIYPWWPEAADAQLEEPSAVPVASIDEQPRGIHLAAWQVPSSQEPSPREEMSATKRTYLSPAFFLGRAAAYFALMIGLAWGLTRRADSSGPRRPQRLRRLSAGGVVLLGLMVTFAAIDWAMSLDPRWYSTIYGALMAIGGVLAAFAWVTLVAARLEACLGSRRSVISSDTLNDLGSLLLAFLILWAYFAFSQFLIIWSGNLPEENVWYVSRLRGGWQWFPPAIAVLQFAVPLVLLLSRDVKQSPRRLAAVAALILGMQWVFFLWTIGPSLHAELLSAVGMEAAAVAAVGGLWTCVFAWRLERRLPRLTAPKGPFVEINQEESGAADR